MPVVHGDARRSALDARARQHAAAGDGRAARRREALATRACTRCSICASSAAPARASARSASTWRDSRASSSSGYWDRHGLSLAAQAFGSAHGGGGMGQPPSRRSRTRSPNSAIARVGRRNRLIGVDRRRSLPQWTRQHAAKAALRDRGSGIRRSADGIQDARCCLPTRSPNHADPEIGLAAIDVMNAAGITTQLAPNVCCGRPLISQGRSAGSAPARRGQRPRAVRRRRSAARRSCSSSRAACPRCAKMRRICCAASCSAAPAWSRRQSVLFEEFLERECAHGRATLALKPGPARGAAAPALPPAIDGPGGAGQGAAVADPVGDGHRSRCRLLRHGGIVRLHARSLRRVARDCRA